MTTIVLHSYGWNEGDIDRHSASIILFANRNLVQFPTALMDCFNQEILFTGTHVFAEETLSMIIFTLLNNAKFDNCAAWYIFYFVFLVMGREISK